MLFGQLDWHALNDFLVVTLESSVKDTITVDDDETKLVIIFKQGEQWLRVEAVLALVGEDVDGSEGGQVNLDLLLSLAILHKDDTTEDAKTVLGDSLVELQSLARRSDRGDDGLTRLTRLDGLSARQLLVQQLHVLAQRVACGDVQGHEGSTVSRQINHVKFCF